MKTGLLLAAGVVAAVVIFGLQFYNTESRIPPKVVDHVDL